jgi:hypothetical protein
MTWGIVIVMMKVVKVHNSPSIMKKSHVWWGVDDDEPTEAATRVITINPVAHTGLCCFWDTEPIEGVPMYIPHRLDRRSDIYYCQARPFCSLQCILAYINEHRSARSNPMVQSWIQDIARSKYDNGWRDHYKRAPPREMLKKFGGRLSIGQFRGSVKVYTLLPQGVTVTPVSVSYTPKPKITKTKSKPQLVLKRTVKNKNSARVADLTSVLKA